jgi:hypothetical protein
MGRSQIMAFASTYWVSNQFEMIVDIRYRGLEYDLYENESSQVGCTIRGTWYNEIDAHAVAELVNKVRSAVQFFYRLPVFINGSQASITSNELARAVETEDAYFLSGEFCSLASVYNLGIYTSSSHSDARNWDFRGFIITKKHLQLNVSRSVIADDCPVWSRIEHFLSQRYPLYSPGDPITPARLRYVLSSLQAGKLLLGSVKGVKLFSNPAKTQFFSPEDLAQQPYTFAYPDYQPTLTDRISQRGKILVLSMEDIPSLPQHLPAPERASLFVTRLRQGTLSQQTPGSDDLQLVAAIYKNYIPLEKVPPPLAEFGLIADNDLTLVQRCALRAVRAAQRAARRRLRAAGVALPGPPRKIYVGDSTTADGWTDGTFYIAINKTLLSRLAEGRQMCDYVAAVLVHEWCHQGPEASTHDAEFYRRYHDLTCHPTLALLPYLARILTEKYAGYLVENELPVPLAVAPPSPERVQQRAHRQALKKLHLIVNRRVRAYNIQLYRMSGERRLIQLYMAIKPIQHLIELPPSVGNLMEYLSGISERWPLILDEFGLLFPLLGTASGNVASGNMMPKHPLLKDYTEAKLRRSRLKAERELKKRQEYNSPYRY